MMGFESTNYATASRYILINNHLVHCEFIDLLKAELSPDSFERKQVRDTRHFVSPDFWNSLTLQEKEVFGECLLLLSNEADENFLNN